MLRIDFMPRAHDTALEQAERRFHGVRVDIAVRVLTNVIDSLVLSAIHVIECPRVDRRLVGQNHFDMANNVGLNDCLHCGRLRVLSANQSEVAVMLANPLMQYAPLDQLLVRKENSKTGRPFGTGDVTVSRLQSASF
jgi:hypothetical protein